MMGIEVPETTCWAYYRCNKPFSGIYLVFLLINMQRCTDKHTSSFKMWLCAFGDERKQEFKKKREKLRLAAKVWASQKELCCSETPVCVMNAVRKSWKTQQEQLFVSPSREIGFKWGVPFVFYQYMWCKVIILKNYIVINNSQFIISISCISSYMFRLIYRAIFRLVFGVVCMYNCWCFESDEISYYKE